MLPWNWKPAQLLDNVAQVIDRSDGSAKLARQRTTVRFENEDELSGDGSPSGPSPTSSRSTEKTRRNRRRASVEGMVLEDASSERGTAVERPPSMRRRHNSGDAGGQTALPLAAKLPSPDVPTGGTPAAQPPRSTERRRLQQRRAALNLPLPSCLPAPPSCLPAPSSCLPAPSSLLPAGVRVPDATSSRRASAVATASPSTYHASEQLEPEPEPEPPTACATGVRQPVVPRLSLAATDLRAEGRGATTGMQPGSHGGVEDGLKEATPAGVLKSLAPLARVGTGKNVIMI